MLVGSGVPVEGEMGHKFGTGSCGGILYRQSLCLDIVHMGFIEWRIGGISMGGQLEG